jgi:predicted TIM-barrel fold metal-dependent hydrolase
MRIIDTHLHLIYPEKFSYPWLAGKAIDRPWPVEDYWAEAVPLGIEAALHMEVDVAETDMMAETSFVSTLPRIAGAIAASRPEHADFADQIEQLSAMPEVKGVRRILHEVPDDLSFSDLFVENIRRLADYNLSFDLVLRADQLLEVGQRLVGRAPEVSFILDHCGNPDINGLGLDPWRSAISEMAKLPNLNAKVSGIVNHCDPGWTAETLRPYVEHLIDCFGWDRVVWGSDHPVVTVQGSLTSWVEASRAIVGGCSEEEQARLFHRNAERVYKL